MSKMNGTQKGAIIGASIGATGVVADYALLTSVFGNYYGHSAFSMMSKKDIPSVACRASICGAIGGAIGGVLGYLFW